jgi:hypothetical protein
MANKGQDKRMRSQGEEESHNEPEVTPQSSDREIVDQEPGESQKRNQGEEKDDPLAA